jgi:hypothetical protein
MDGHSFSTTITKVRPELSQQKGPIESVINDFKTYVGGIKDLDFHVASFYNYCPAFEQSNGHTIKKIDTDFLNKLQETSKPETAGENIIGYLDSIGVKGFEKKNL